MKNVQQNSRRWISVAGMVCLMAVSLTSCLKNNNNTVVQPPAAALSVINASPDAPSLDFYLDANKANSYPFGYGNGIDYISAFAGKRQAIFKTAGSATVYKTDSVTLQQNKYYTLYLTNVAPNTEYLLLNDTIVKPADGKASIRLVNVSKDAPAVDLAIKGGPVLVANKSFKGFSGFVPVAVNNNSTIEIRQAGTATVLATIEKVSLNNGSIYTVWLQGLASATDTKKLTALIQTNVFYY
ncbi:hypothetical protein A0256_00055 [Mucilaginibacter sp. PAMC 26640]|nr:hypothetical protein A0256_00055 [Mucilaginibacter sp. PAMC 26640]